MPQPIQRLTVRQFVDLVEGTTWGRRITAVHVHHTWRPRRRDFRGLATIEAMRAYHVRTQGWSDIAQHLTIDPSGHVWTGRSWNTPPASAAGRNGTREAGPFMFEIVGDFDEGQDRLEDAQRQAVIDVTAALLRKWALGADAIYFHRDLGAPKSCPGSGLDRDALVADVLARVSTLPEPTQAVAGARSLFGAEYVLGRAGACPAAEPVREDEEVPEHVHGALAMEAHAREASGMRQTLVLARGDASRGEDPAYDVLRPHVVNLARGELSDTGLFRMRPGSLDAIVQGIRTYAMATESPRLLLYAHGGLVSERGALDYARTVKNWWLRHGVYPVFFVWESDVLAILGQYLIGRRDLADWTSDPAIETAIKLPGSVVWGAMKDSARRASAEDAGSGFAGGARLFGELLPAALAALEGHGRRVQVHAVGHSAGAIFHAHLVPLLHDLGLVVETLAFLAPALRVDLFKAAVLPRIVPPGGAASPGVNRFYVYTMEEEAERSDHCWRVYRKSLLYLVSNAFEGIRGTPLTGLHESLRNDAQMRGLFGLDESGVPAETPTARGTLYRSFARGKTPSPLTRALEHGCFDNDRYTISSVLRRIVGADDESRLGLDDFPFEATEACGFDTADVDAHDRAMRSAFRIAVPTPPAPVPMSPPGHAAVAHGGGRRRALCVGIDGYRDRPLAGCVADARAWGQHLQALGFDVTHLFDDQATRDGIVQALEDLVRGGGSGDVLVFQYSGHGSQVPDDDGDETDQFDEVFVPVDYHAGALLLDDDLAEILGGLAPGVLCTLFMDCCHSGTNSRFAPLRRPLVTGDERVRFLPLDAAVQDAHRARRAAMGAPRKTAAEKSVSGVVHLAACLDNEYAWESEGQGDFTGAAIRLLSAAVARGDTNESFVGAVREALAVRNRQHPALMPLPSGLEGRPLLAPLVPAAAGPSSVVPASSIDGRLLQHLEAMAALLRARVDGR